MIAYIHGLCVGECLPYQRLTRTGNGDWGAIRTAAGVYFKSFNDDQL